MDGCERGCEDSCTSSQGTALRHEMNLTGGSALNGWIHFNSHSFFLSVYFADRGIDTTHSEILQ